MILSTAVDALMFSLKHAGVFYAVLHVWHCMVLDLLSTHDELSGR